MAKKKVVIIGGGLAGLMAALRLAERGLAVDILSLVPVKRSHSACAQGGINAVLDSKGEDDSLWEHFYDTIYGGDFLANQKPVQRMVETAPELIYMMDRMGVLFNRTQEGVLDLRRFGGVKKRRTVFAGSTTGQQLLYACDEQVRRHEGEGSIRKFEGWAFLSAIIDADGACRGCVGQNLNTMEIRCFPADALIIATGGAGMIYGVSSNSTINTGAAAGSVYRQGVDFANGEFVQFHPTSLTGDDKMRLMSESARGDGGRIWTYKDGKPWYFLEEMFPAYGNLVPRDIASRAIYQVCVEMGLGIDGKNQVYLDFSHLDDDYLDRRLSGIIHMCAKFAGIDAHREPVKVFPTPHYFMGGLHVDDQHMTKIPGLFAIGECDYLYHGANRLGANSLLSALFSGYDCAPHVLNFVNGFTKNDTTGREAAANELARQEQEYQTILRMSGPENPYVLHRELGKLMHQHVGIVRTNAGLAKADEEIRALMARFRDIGISDKNDCCNQMAFFIRDLWNMLELARVITLSALNRNESRGAHYKPEFPERNDKDYLRTSIASWTPQGPKLSWEDVDTSLLAPVERNYKQ